MRVCVEIGINDVLPEVVYIKEPGESVSEQKVEHEWVPSTCKYSNVFGHVDSTCNRKSVMKQLWEKKPNVEAGKLVNVVLERTPSQEADSNPKDPIFSSEWGDMNKENVTPIANSVAKIDYSKVKNVTNGGEKNKIYELVVQKEGGERTSGLNNQSEKKRTDKAKCNIHVSNRFAALEDSNNLNIIDDKVEMNRKKESGQMDRLRNWVK